MITLGLQGASGRTGSLVLSVIDEFSTINLGAALVSVDSKSLNRIAHDSIKFTSSIEDAVERCSLFVDFSTPESSLRLASLCAKHRKPLLIATTGLSDSDLKCINQASEHTAILIAPNTSLGVFALKEISLHAQQILGDSYDIEISEIHHRMKKDAPSGTALYLANALSEKNKIPLNYDRSGACEARQNDIGVTSIRGGDVAGEHTINFIGRGERIELIHRVWDRKIFARGALMLAQRLYGRPCGLYRLDSSFMRP